ncbi:TrmO family methyltransferase domain-containing protein [Tindallia californiensis]|uniref:UvrABC system protein A n=1 Tax=Tindallia californiensis TaxID=159292 RepID=A0A1H3Q6W5_9FIRM|nr:TrmO family methyltransferase [Tindallia californiensis]SDZ08848.1 excinuclease ABC, A subunit [Tindallia californiensis]
MKWISIGTVVATPEREKVSVQLYSGYEKALDKLHLFSHCLLFHLTEDQIQISVTEIVNVSMKNRELLLAFPEQKRLKTTSENPVFSGQLVDIKPYFPAEEVVLDPPENIKAFSIHSLSFIGEYNLQGNQPIIQLYEKMLPLPNTLISNNSYARVLWYFDRFDSRHYRRIRTCTPPYNNAPRTGIFASRSPVRPNPLGSTIVKIQDCHSSSGTIKIEGFDGFPGTKIFQIIAYDPLIESIPTAKIPPWVSHWSSFKRFSKPKAIPSFCEGSVEKEFYQEPLDLQRPVKHPDLEETLSADQEEDPDKIHVHHASIHNLKSVSVSIPKNSITVITGVSGSGKSSLAFDTLYTESQKQFMDLTFSNPLTENALLDISVDKISGLLPSIAIKQQSFHSNPRSTVGTLTKVADLLKLIFTVIGERKCPVCHQKIDASHVCSKCGEILFDSTPQIFNYNHPDYMCPVCKGLGVQRQVDQSKIVEYPEKSLLDGASSFYGNLRKHRKKPNANWIRGEILALAEDLKEDLSLPFHQLSSSFKQQFFHGSKGREVRLAYETAKGTSGIISRPVEGALSIIQRLSSDSRTSKGHNSLKKYMSSSLCCHCQGERLLEEARLINIHGYRYPQIVTLSITELQNWCHGIYGKLTKQQQQKTSTLFRKLNHRLNRMHSVGLGYLSLNRNLPSLSGGEAQRLKLAIQLGTGLSGILYILDEPSKGLHPKDYQFLLKGITALKETGNTVIVVEHKQCFLSIADMHLRMGPKAGRYGGELVLVQHRQEIKASLSEDHWHPQRNQLSLADRFPETCFFKDSTKKNPPFIHLKKVSTNNLKGIDVAFPIGMISAVIGVSGSGKSSLVTKTLYPYLLKTLGKSVDTTGTFEEITGLETIQKVFYVHQHPIGNHSRSNPGTYIGVFDLIRNYYAATDAAKKQGFTKDYFSFNSKKGQCPDCLGLGEIPIDNHYMEGVYIPCSLCQGKRYTTEVLEIKVKQLSIGDILDMEIHDLMDFFQDEQEIFHLISMLHKVGLGYLKLGQKASSLSGGESQRLKLAKELSKKHNYHSLYILDEPTTGLSNEDVNKVLLLLKELQAKGATIIIIEHHPHILSECDYIIELGPGGGHQGGRLLQCGFPEPPAD